MQRLYVKLNQFDSLNAAVLCKIASLFMLELRHKDVFLFLCKLFPGAAVKKSGRSTVARPPPSQRHTSACLSFIKPQDVHSPPQMSHS